MNMAFTMLQFSYIYWKIFFATWKLQSTVKKQTRTEVNFIKLRQFRRDKLPSLGLAWIGELVSSETVASLIKLLQNGFSFFSNCVRKNCTIESTTVYCEHLNCSAMILLVPFIKYLSPPGGPCDDLPRSLLRGRSAGDRQLHPPRGASSAP